MNTTTTPKSRYGFAPVTIVLAVLAVLALVFSTNEQGGGFTGMMRSKMGWAVPPMVEYGNLGVTGGAPKAGVVVDASSPASYATPAPSGSPADLREFNKMYYNATLRTRDVQGLTQRVETTVHGHGGRIDGLSSSKMYGYVTFAIAASKFDAFRSELESFVDGRFLTINVNSQNMLPQKQSIEAQQQSAEATLAEFTTSRTKLVAAHTATLSSIQTQMNADAKELAALNAEVTSDANRQAYISKRQADIRVEQGTLNSQYTNENATYASRLAAIDAQIANSTKMLTAIKTQDKNLLDEVATVNGTISLNWISLWDMIQHYIPGPGIAALLAFAAVAHEWWYRRRA